MARYYSVTHITGEGVEIRASHPKAKQVIWGWGSDKGANIQLYGHEESPGRVGDNAPWVWTLDADGVAALVAGLRAEIADPVKYECDAFERRRAPELLEALTRQDVPALDPFTLGYVRAALWSSNDESTPAGGSPMDENYSIEDIAPKTLRAMIEDCARFQRENVEDLSRARAPDYNGHDFWLTRNHHGVGFWDRDLGAVGERLTAAAHAFGECTLYVGDDGRIYAA